MDLVEKPVKATKRDPMGARRNILRVASKEFAEYGLSGARVDEIAARTRTSKRMIYYYFQDKEELYRACLEAAYSHVRAGEEKLDLGGLEPDKALAKLVGFTFEHHRKNPDFIRLVMIENIHKAAYLTGSDIIRGVNAAAIETLTDIILRGRASGVFRDDLDPIELHWQISALSFFNVSNKPTFSALFNSKLYSEEGQRSLRDHAVEMILLYVCNRKRTTQ